MAETVGNPRLRVLHASPDAPPVDIHVDGAPVIMALAYGQISDYTVLPRGSHNIKVYPIAAGAQVSPLSETTLIFSAGQDYTIAAVGRLENIQPIVLLDSTPPPQENRAKVRFVHASPDAPALDFAIAGGSTLFTDISFKQVTPYLEVNAGRSDLEFRPTGQSKVIFDLPYYTLNAGDLYTFVALGLLEGIPAFMVMPLAESIELRLPV